MAVFAVIATAPSQELERSIKLHFPDDHLALGENEWLVSGKGISKEIAEKIGIGKDGIVNAIVFSTSGYWGWANNSVWEWLALKTTSGSISVASVAKDA